MLETTLLLWNRLSNRSCTAQSTLSPPMDRKQQQRQEKFIAELMAKDEGNKNCADCSQKGTRWASWNIGVFLCIHCGAIHRKMGPHISKVKSISLDSWTEEQLQWIAERGNTKMNRFYNPSERQFPFHGEAAKEQFIRDKYERKSFVANAQIRQSLEHEQQEFTARHAKMSRPWAHELAKLKEMGFVEEGQEEACYAVCELFKGDVNQSIAYLLEHQARKDKAPMQLSAKHLQKPTPLQLKVEKCTLAEGEILRQLKKMGFKDERENLTTLRSCDGDLGKYVMQPIQHLKQEQTSESGWEEEAVEFNEFVSTPIATSIHSDKKTLSNNDILSLFDDFSPAVQHKQREQHSSKPLITKELLDIFSPVQDASQKLLVLLLLQPTAVLVIHSMKVLQKMNSNLHLHLLLKLRLTLSQLLLYLCQSMTIFFPPILWLDQLNCHFILRNCAGVAKCTSSF